jgi:protein O-GlcNAc transferase
MLVRQIWQDQKLLVNGDAYRLGCGGLVADEPEQQAIDSSLLLQVAALFYGLGHLTKADLLCSYLVDRGMSGLELLMVQQGIRRSLVKDRNLTGQDVQPEKYLIIKSWGTGYWSDIDNLLGNLLLAEITGRVPVIDWSSGSLFRGDGDLDSFADFWEPVSKLSVADLTSAQFSYFPPKWNSSNLGQGNLNKSQGPYSRMAWHYYLHRNETVLVSDYFVAINDLRPWLQEDHWLRGLSAEEVYRRLFAKYLHLKPEIDAEIETFWAEHMDGPPVIAVHIRGSDKFTEDQNLTLLNQLYGAAISKVLENCPDARIFLMTDTEQIATEYQAVYGERLIIPPCFRTSSAVGVHFQKTADHRQLVTEVIRDVLLAVRCNQFIGNGLSNVSAAVAYMKEWPHDSCRLLGAKTITMRRLTYYNDLPQNQEEIKYGE